MQVREGKVMEERKRLVIGGRGGRVEEVGEICMLEVGEVR